MIGIHNRDEAGIVPTTFNLYHPLPDAPVAIESVLIELLIKLQPETVPVTPERTTDPFAKSTIS